MDETHSEIIILKKNMYNTTMITTLIVIMIRTIGRITVITVSYTHLDVYKRQTMPM